MNRTLVIICCVLTCVMLNSCVPREDEMETVAVDDPSEALLAEWLSGADNPREAMVDPRIPEIAITLALQGPEALEPALDVLADPDRDPGEKLLITQGLTAVLALADETDELLDAIAEMSGEDYETTTRACALQLLAIEQDPRFEDIFAQHVDDADPRVRLAAASGLSMLGQERGREKLREFASDQNAPMDQRIRSLIDLAAGAQPGDVPVFLDAIEDSDVPMQVRIQLLSALAGTADETFLERIRAFAEDESTPEELQSIGQAVVMAIENQQGAQPQPVSED